MPVTELHVWLGWLSSVAFIITLWGALHQSLLLRNIAFGPGENKFSNLSLAYFFAYFLGVFIFYAYGYVLPGRDFFLMTTRGAAALIAISMLFFFCVGKRSSRSLAALITAVALLAASPALILQHVASNKDVVEAIKAVMLCVTAYGMQAYLIQIRGIVTSSSSKGLSKIMNFTIAVKDVSVLAYGLTYSFSDSWPIVAQATMNGTFRITLLYLCFRYADTNRDQLIQPT